VSRTRQILAYTIILLILTPVISLVLAVGNLVEESNTSKATEYTFQRKTFYANGRYWVFYVDENYLRFKTSTDGSTWSSATSIHAIAYNDGYEFSVWFDGTYVHIAYVYLVYGLEWTLFYRRGTPNSDGTITWSADDQEVYHGTSSVYYHIPMISVDSAGHAWIGVLYYNGSINSIYPCVFKNANTDGTWSTADGFPYLLNSTADTGWGVIPVPLTGGKVYVVYFRTKVRPAGRLYDGVNWGDEEIAADHEVNPWRPNCLSAVGEGDNVHIVFNHYSSTGQIYYNKRVYGSGWGSDVLVQDSVPSDTYPTLSIDSSSGDLYCFWVDSDHVYYKKYDSSTGTWDATPTDWIDESEERIYYKDTLTSFYSSYANYVGVLYTTKKSGPYNVKFAYLTISTGNTPPNAPTLDSPADSDRFNPGASVTFTWTFSDPDVGDSQSAYQFQLDDDCDFSSPVIDTGKVSSSSTSTTQALPSTVGLYYWRVKTWDSQDAEGPYSSGRAVIVDRILVYSLTADDTRRDVGTTVTLTIHLHYEYDGADITSGSFTLNGLTLTHQTGGDWTATDSKDAVQAVTYDSVSGSVGNLNTVNMNGKNVTVIWDALKADGYSIDMISGEVYIHMVYAYDGADVAGGTVCFAGVTALTNGTGWAEFNSTNLPSDFDWGQTAYGVQDALYGITYKAQNQTLPVAKRGARLVESDVELASLTWDGSLLTVGFAESQSVYTLKVSGPRPVYVLNATYDLDSDYDGYLTLSHDGSRPIVIAWKSWGGLRVRGLTHGRLTSVTLVSQVLTVVVNGSAGSGTLYVDCTGWGAPQRTSGFDEAWYSSADSLFWGTYTLSSSRTLTLDWSIGTGGGEGGGTPPALDIRVQTLTLEATQGREERAELTVTWTGTTQVTVEAVTFGEYTEWFALADALPLTLTSTEPIKTGTLTIRVRPPATAQPGNYTIPVELRLSATGYATIRANTYIYLNVLPYERAPARGPIPNIIGYALGIGLTTALAVALWKRE